MSDRRITPRGLAMALAFGAAAVVSFLLLFLRGWTLPLGLVLFGRLAFVGVEARLLGATGGWRTLPLMYRLGLGMHVLLATGLTLYGLAQLAGLV